MRGSSKRRRKASRGRPKKPKRNLYATGTRSRHHRVKGNFTQIVSGKRTEEKKKAKPNREKPIPKKSKRPRSGNSGTRIQVNVRIEKEEGGVP